MRTAGETSNCKDMISAFFSMRFNIYAGNVVRNVINAENLDTIDSLHFGGNANPGLRFADDTVVLTDRAIVL